ncbi:MAG: T9SS type A sorting domain-containing protein [Ignavibacteria bacterium]|nr:T9SS type A sorting domain-containing protein [Ignavibacteria bacterium]
MLRSRVLHGVLLATGAMALCMAALCPEARAQLVVDSSLSPGELVKRYFEGGCVEITGVATRGYRYGIAKYIGTRSNIGIDSGVMLTTGFAAGPVGPNDSPKKSFNARQGGDADLDKLITGGTQDAVVLEFDFVSFIDTASFEYVFASEEYPEFVGSKYNDVFGFFVTNLATGVKKNLALIPSSNFPVSVNTINGFSFGHLYVDNAAGVTVQFDGFTTVLRAKMAVTPCAKYHMKIAIADVGDGIYDSGVFLKAGSFNAGARLKVKKIVDPYENGCRPGLFRFYRNGSPALPQTISYQVRGNAADSIDYAHLSGQITFPAGLDSIDLPIVPVRDTVVDANEMIIISVNNACFCGATEDTLFIREAPPLQLTMPRDSTFCPGGSVTFRARSMGGSGQLAWKWSAGKAGDSVLVASPSRTTVYTLTLTDVRTGCVLRDSLRLTALSPPPADAGSDLTICRRKGAVIGTPKPVWPDSLRYAWKPAAGLSDSTIPQPFANPTRTTIYQLTVSGSAGCVSTDLVTVRASNLSVGMSSLKTVCAGGTVQIGGNAAGGVEPYRFLWEPASSLDSITVSAPRASPLQTTRYRLTVRDALGCVAVDSVLVYVLPSPKPKIAPQGPVRICEGQAVTLRAPAGYASYRWNTMETTPSITANASFNYAVTVTDSNGCTGSDTMRVTVLPRPQPLVLPGGPLSFCDGDSVQLRASLGGVTYRWTTGASTRAIMVRVAGRYGVTVTDSNGCWGTSPPVDIVVHRRPQPVIAGPAVVCTGSAAVYDAGTDADSFAWNAERGAIIGGAGTRNITVRWDSAGAGRLTLLAVDTASGCAGAAQFPVGIGSSFAFSITTPRGLRACEGDTLLLEAPPGLHDWRWSTGATTRSLAVTATGSYSIAATDSAGCPGVSDTIAVTFVAAPQPVVAGPARMCLGANGSYAVATLPGAGTDWAVEGGSIITGGGTSRIDVHWDAAGAGRVRARQTLDTLGCSGEDSLDVDVIPAPQPSISVDGSLTPCEGDSTVLSVPPMARYAWSNGGAAQRIVVRAAGRYFCAVVDSNGCPGNSDSVDVVFLPRSVTRIAPMGPTAFCEGDSVLLDAGDFASYRWSTGDSMRTLRVTRGGAYRVEVRGAGACFGASDTVLVTVHPKPTAAIARIADTLVASPSGMRYRWYRDGAPLSADSSERLAISGDGEYAVLVTTAQGCSALSSVLAVHRGRLDAALSVDCPGGLEVSPGEVFTLPLRMTLPDAFAGSGISAVEVTLRYRAGVFAPLGAECVAQREEGGEQFCTVRMDLATVAGGTVRISLPMLAMLGDTACSALRVDAVRWIGGALPLTVEGEGCAVCLKICREGGERLFDARARLSLSAQPNPFNASTVIRYTVIEAARTELFLADALGRRVAVLADEIMQPGERRIGYDASALSSGVYLLVLRTPGTAAALRLLVIK